MQKWPIWLIRPEKLDNLGPLSVSDQKPRTTWVAVTPMAFTLMDPARPGRWSEARRQHFGSLEMSWQGVAPHLGICKTRPNWKDSMCLGQGALPESISAIREKSRQTGGKARIISVSNFPVQSVNCDRASSKRPANCQTSCGLTHLTLSQS